MAALRAMLDSRSGDAILHAGISFQTPNRGPWLVRRRLARMLLLFLVDSICLAPRGVGPLSPAAGFHRSAAGEPLDDNDEHEQQRRTNHK